MDLLPSTPIVLSYNIFPPLPQRSTMEKALWMAQGHRARSLPSVSDSHLALQITTQHYSENKLESPNCTSLLYEGQHEEIPVGESKKKKEEEEDSPPQGHNKCYCLLSCPSH